MVMARRVTIMLDDDLVTKIRQKQAKLIQKENESVSFSKVLNSLLEDSLKR